MNSLDVNSLVIKHYHYQNDPVRVLIQHNQAWFFIEDLCRLLGYRDVAQASQYLTERDRLDLNFWRVHQYAPLLIHEIWDETADLHKIFTNEFGVSDLILHSPISNMDPVYYWLTYSLIPALVPTGDKAINSKYEHHKHLLNRFGWRMIQNKLSINSI